MSVLDVVIGVAFTSVGVYIIYLSWREDGIYRELRASGIQIDSTVTDVTLKGRRYGQRGSSQRYVVTYTYTVNDSTPLTIKKTIRSYEDVPAVADVVTLLALPDNPQRARVASDVEDMKPIYGIGCGLLFVAVGILALLIVIAGT